MISIKEESWGEVFEELKPLFDPHYRELALNQDKVPLDPQYEIYHERDRAGQVLVVVARDKGRVAGYFIGFVGPGLHYRTCMTLQMDVFWVHPDYRGEDSLGKFEEFMLGEAIFKHVESVARARGVQRIFVGSKLHKDASALFERLEYREVERYYTLWIGG